MARYDFFNTYATATLIDSEGGERFPLWTQVRPAGPAAPSKMDLAGLESFPYLQNLQVQWNLADFPRISATFTPTYEDAIKFMNSGLVNWSKTLLEVSYGHVAVGSTGAFPSVSPAFVGITLKPDIRFGQDVSITLIAQGIGGYGLGRQTGGDVPPDDTRENLIKFILKNLSSAAANHVFSLDISDILGSTSDPSSLAVQELKLLRTTIPFIGGYKTDLTNLHDLVQSCGCMILFDTETKAIAGTGENRVYYNHKVRMIPRSRMEADPGPYTFVYRDYRSHAGSAELGPNVNEFPIMDVSSPTSHQWLPAEASVGISRTSVDAKGKTTVSVTSPKTKPSTKDGKLNTGQTNSAPVRMVSSAETEDPRVQAVAEEQTSRAKNMAGVTLEIETLLIPELQPGIIISIRGLGDKINGKYMIMELTHNFGSGGASTSFRCLSNTVPWGKEPGFKELPAITGTARVTGDVTTTNAKAVPVVSRTTDTTAVVKKSIDARTAEFVVSEIAKAIR